MAQIGPNESGSGDGGRVSEFIEVDKVGRAWAHLDCGAAAWRTSSWCSLGVTLCGGGVSGAGSNTPIN